MKQPWACGTRRARNNCATSWPSCGRCCSVTPRSRRTGSTCASDGFGAYSLDLAVFAYIRTRDWLNYRAIREDINLRIMDIVKEAGTGFAFPSQTAYFGRDAGLDAGRGQEAETQVQEWRSKGQLPFPEFDEGVRGEKEDILDYPPEGTPGYKPRAGVSKTQSRTASGTRVSQPRTHRNAPRRVAEKRSHLRPN